MIVVLSNQYLPMPIKDSTNSKRTKTSKTSKGNNSRVSSPSRVSTPSRDRQRLYYVLTEHENNSCLQNFVGKCIIFQAPNNVAANVFRNVVYVRCNK